MNTDKIYTLEDRGIIYIHGEDVLEYLQNIITFFKNVRSYN